MDPSNPSDSDQLFSREEILGSGLIGRRATRELLQIEGRTIYMIEQAQQALWAILEQRPLSVTGMDYWQIMKIKADADYRITIMDLERYAPIWGPDLPDDPKVLAALARLIGRKYTFSYRDVPNIRAALGLDVEDVKAAFEDVAKQPIDSIYSDKTDNSLRRVRGDAPAWLRQDEIYAIESQLEWVYLAWGEVLFYQGDPGDGLYVVINGRLRIVLEDDEGNERIIRELGRGEILGEMAILTDAPRSATVYAIRETELVRLGRVGVNHLMAEQPKVMMNITRQMVSRAQESASKHVIKNKLVSLAVVPADGEIDADSFTEQLVTALESFGKVLRLNEETFKELQSNVGMTSGDDDGPVNTTLWWLGELETTYRFLVFEATASLDAWTRRCLSQADRILIVARGDAPANLGQIEQRLYRPEIERIATGRELVLVHPSRDRIPQGTQDWLNQRLLIHHHHIVSHDPGDFQRLSRFLAGEAVGLVLGGGGGLRGIAHVGVILALEEAGLRPDYIGGTGTGALIGAAYALGMDSALLRQQAAYFAQQANAFLRFNASSASLADTSTLDQLVQRTFGNLNIEDLWVPFYCTVTDLNKAAEVVCDTGPLATYVRASLTVPGIFPPVRVGSRLLATGGILNNVPVDVMNQRVEGADVIGVDVVPTEDNLTTLKLSMSPKGLGFTLSQTPPFGSPRTPPDLFEVILRAQALQSASERQRIENIANVLIQPPVGAVRGFEPAAVQQLIEYGYRSAQGQIAVWQHNQQGG
ncbi:MAG: cyclic nucleotide-binding domain-containing protein [Chloroflexi bacterium]|nr:cyclic nucleotide-binding domain-containing protein [Chloroflexota bacterium]